MRMAAYDHVDLALQITGKVHDLAGTLGCAIPAALGTRMGDHDDEVCATPSKRGSNAVDDRGGIIEAQTRDIARSRGRRCGDGRNPDDADLRPTACDNGVVPNPLNVTPVRVTDVRAENGVPGLSHSGAQGVNAPIELVVAECGSSVAHSIVVVDDGAAEVEIRGGCPLKHVSAVEQQRLAPWNAFAARAFDSGCNVSRAPPRHSVGVGTRLERAVKIVGANYSEESRSGWECRSRARDRRRNYGIYRRECRLRCCGSSGQCPVLPEVVGLVE